MEFKIVVKNDKGEYIHESEFMDSERAMAYIRSYLVLNNVSRPTKDAPDLGESSASDSESTPAPKQVI